MKKFLKAVRNAPLLILKAIFINWWWGFWRKKQKEERVSVVDIEAPNLTISDLIAAQVILQNPDPVEVDDNDDPIYHPDWHDARLWLFTVPQDRKVDAIKAVRALSNAGLRESKACIDNEASLQSLLGPFLVGPDEVVAIFENMGCDIVLMLRDEQDGQLAIQREDLDEDDPYWQTVLSKWNEYVDDEDDDWVDYDNLPDNHPIFDSGNDNSEDHEDFWLSNMDRYVDHLQRAVPIPAPEDIDFGHEEPDFSEEHVIEQR